MPREKPMYRENLETINKQFPDKEALSYKEIAALFGYSYHTALRHWSGIYNKAIGGVPKTTIARAMCS